MPRGGKRPGSMVRAYRALMGKDTEPQQKILDDYMQWANLVLRWECPSQYPRLSPT